MLGLTPFFGECNELSKRISIYITYKMSRTFATRFSHVVQLRICSLQKTSLFISRRVLFLMRKLWDFGFEWELKKVSGVLDEEEGTPAGGANAVNK